MLVLKWSHPVNTQYQYHASQHAKEDIRRTLWVALLSLRCKSGSKFPPFISRFSNLATNSFDVFCFSLACSYICAALRCTCPFVHVKYVQMSAFHSWHMSSCQSELQLETSWPVQTELLLTQCEASAANRQNLTRAINLHVLEKPVGPFHQSAAEYSHRKKIKHTCEPQNVPCVL